MKFFTRVALVSAALTMTPAWAQTMGGPAPDTGAGKKRAAVCFSCHGETGVAPLPATPHLAGQKADYLQKALQAYRSGQRQDPAMTAMAKPLSDQDIANIAAYFATQTAAAPGSRR